MRLIFEFAGRACVSMEFDAANSSTGKTVGIRDGKGIGVPTGTAVSCENTPDHSLLAIAASSGDNEVPEVLGGFKFNGLIPAESVIEGIK